MSSITQIYVIRQNSRRRFTLYNASGHVKSMVSQATSLEVILLKLQSVFLLQHNLIKKRKELHDLQTENLKLKYGKQTGCVGRRG